MLDVTKLKPGDSVYETPCEIRSHFQISDFTRCIFEVQYGQDVVGVRSPGDSSKCILPTRPRPCSELYNTRSEAIEAAIADLESTLELARAELAKEKR